MVPPIGRKFQIIREQAAIHPLATSFNPKRNVTAILSHRHLLVIARATQDDDTRPLLKGLGREANQGRGRGSCRTNLCAASRHARPHGFIFAGNPDCAMA